MDVTFNTDSVESRSANLKVGQTLGMSVLPSGELHVYVDGEDIGTPWKNLSIDKPFYGVVGLENFSRSTYAWQL